MENKYKVKLTTTATAVTIVTADTEEDAIEQINYQDPHSFNWNIEIPYEFWEVDNIE